MLSNVGNNCRLSDFLYKFNLLEKGADASFLQSGMTQEKVQRVIFMKKFTCDSFSLIIIQKESFLAV